MTGDLRKALADFTKTTGKAFAATVLAVTMTLATCQTVYAGESADSGGNSPMLFDHMAAGAVQAISVQVLRDGNRSGLTVDDGGAREPAAARQEKNDRVEEPRAARVREDEAVTISRAVQATETREEELPYNIETIPTSLLAPGKEKVLVEGRSGLQLATYGQVAENGEERRELLEAQTLEKPVARKVLVGEPAHPVSTLDHGYELDDSGEPVGYAKVLRGQRAAGYSARPGARTASGREAVVGHVAVNPGVIPYGTKLYIKSTDGSFVYGYAVAADTGTAIRDGVIAVDLFYGSYTESALNGIKTVDIFVLE